MSRRTKVSLTQHYRRTKWFDTKLNMINTYPKGRSSRSRYILLSPILWACIVPRSASSKHFTGEETVSLRYPFAARLRMNGLFSHQTWLVVFRPTLLKNMSSSVGMVKIPNILVSTPLKNMNSSVGMMKIPTIWKVIKFHGSSHHQPETYSTASYV